MTGIRLDAINIHIDEIVWDEPAGPVRAVDLDASSRGASWPPSVATASGGRRRPHAADSGEAAPTTAPARLDWEHETSAEAGLFGRLLLETDEAVGWMQAAPGRLVPRLRGLPAGRRRPTPSCSPARTSTTRSTWPAFRTCSTTSSRRSSSATCSTLEAYALRDLRPDDRFRGYLRELNLFNAQRAEGQRLSAVSPRRAPSAATGLELATLVAAPRYAAPEQRAAQAGRSGRR